ncbi:MAG: deoxyribodipyrimidine photo-lyase [Pseudomonadota bacterium]
MLTSPAVVWFRRDLRLHDNPALQQALNAHQKIILVYISENEELAPWTSGAASNWWLHQSLQSLISDLAETGAHLTLLQGPAEAALHAICQQHNISHVYWNRLYDPETVTRDKAVKASLQAAGVQVQSFGGYLLREPWETLNKQGEPYRVYTPFSKNYFVLPPVETPASTPVNLQNRTLTCAGSALNDFHLLPGKDWGHRLANHWSPGEKPALSRLQEFLTSAVFDYKDARDIPAVDGISRMSAHLHFGEISSRQIWHAVQQQGVAQSKEDAVFPFLRQLIWRDFAHHLLFHFPHTTHSPFLPMFEKFPWQQNKEFLQAWQRGRTGIPLVDAAMQELWLTGWMHNRTRMLVASLLTKNGLIHWIEGARWFWDTLVDANLANNTMGWQWTAGCGVDAAPYFRIFSPTRQGERFDVEGRYVKRWVPELAEIPNRYIHEPWRAGESVLDDAGLDRNSIYRQPIVDLSTTRTRALALYKELRST